jgi:hypothetical protein
MAVLPPPPLMMLLLLPASCRAVVAGRLPC